MSSTPDNWTVRRGLLQAVLITVVTLIALGIYLGVLWWRGPSATICTQMEWEKRFPFLYGWVWVYLIPYVLGPIAAFLMRWDTLVWFLQRAVPVVVISNLVFIVLPTKTAPHRIEEVGGTDFTSWMYRNMAETDGPAANAAPSLHVSLSCLLALALIRNYPRLWWVWIVSCVLIWLSTLFTWQHHLIDVVTGATLGAGSAIPWKRRET